jgi:hypothetical protein
MYEMFARSIETKFRMNLEVALHWPHDPRLAAAFSHTTRAHWRMNVLIARTYCIFGVYNQSWLGEYWQVTWRLLTAPRTKHLAPYCRESVVYVSVRVFVLIFLALGGFTSLCGACYKCQFVRLSVGAHTAVWRNEPHFHTINKIINVFYFPSLYKWRLYDILTGTCKQNSKVYDNKKRAFLASRATTEWFKWSTLPEYILTSFSCLCRRKDIS